MASQQFAAQLEASFVEELQPTGKVITSGSTCFNPLVENRVSITLELLKKPLDVYPFSDFKLKVTAAGNVHLVQDFNSFVGAMKPNTIALARVSARLTRNPFATNSKIYYELVDQAPLAGDFLVSNGSSIEVVPTASN